MASDQRLDDVDYLASVPSRPGRSRVATDFFTLDTALLAHLYALFFIELGRRRVWITGITEHPDGPWVTQQRGT